ncbi:hypothetical protein K0A97_00780 [Patescibacteria group bacterium]|nr:hypothetical protein [Patescibacteria group bacterium]
MNFLNILEYLKVGGSGDFGFLEVITLLFAFLYLFALLFIGIYVYLSLAFTAIAKKNKLDHPGIAWIPSFGPKIIAFKISKMHWWPWLLYVPLFLSWILILFNPLLGYFFYIPGSLALAAFFIIWDWKMFESVNKPGWWALTVLFLPLYLVFVGIAAWSDKKKISESKSRNELNSRKNKPNLRKKVK